MLPLVSVVIPCYNRTDVIGRAVQSVLLQTYTAFEITVVDDGSEDHEALAARMEQFHDSRLRLVRHPANRNGAAARNTGVRESRGELVAFLDSDDEWMPEKLEMQVRMFQEHRSSKAVVYAQSVVLTTANGKANEDIWPKHCIASGERMTDYLFIHMGYVPTPSILLSRTEALHTPFNEQLRRHQDYDLLLRLEANGCEFLMVLKPLVIVHWEGLSTSGRSLNPTQTFTFLSEYRQYFSAPAASGFVLRQVVFPLLKERRRKEAWLVLRHYTIPKYFRLVNWIQILSLFAFGDARLVKFVVYLRNSLHRRCFSLVDNKISS